MARGGFDQRNINGNTLRDYLGKITLYHVRVTCLVAALSCWIFEYDLIGISDAVASLPLFLKKHFPSFDLTDESALFIFRLFLAARELLGFSGILWVAKKLGGEILYYALIGNFVYAAASIFNFVVANSNVFMRLIGRVCWAIGMGVKIHTHIYLPFASNRPISN
ncbi:sugar carrier protein C-like [Juglans microcarpa x Juglans regia]|uniref:sugar carrier protein C-like n=1 Tax=Juglans microcarpa x Juglans regia TaxID=2249226 RepID=UPI001B7E64A1|nr:sugar carrier protein C-like [Juglans microcarpa x Juglans regia]